MSYRDGIGWIGGVLLGTIVGGFVQSSIDGQPATPSAAALTGDRAVLAEGGGYWAHHVCRTPLEVTMFLARLGPVASQAKVFSFTDRRGVAFMVVYREVKK